MVDIIVDQVRMLMSSVSKFYIIKTESFLISLSKLTNALLKKKLICEDEWVTTLDIVLANIVFYSFIKSQEIKESVPSDLRQQVFLLVRPMHQVSIHLTFSLSLSPSLGWVPYSIWLQHESQLIGDNWTIHVLIGCL